MPSSAHDYDDLPPSTRTRLYAVDDAKDKVVAEAAPELAATRQAVLAAYAAVSLAHKLFREAAADLITFARACGAQVERAVWWERALAGGVLFVITLAETALGFPGIRFALVHEGDIRYPWEDPLALVAASGLGLASLMLAKAAAREWMAADRDTLHEPVPATVSHDARVPVALLDGDAGRLIPDSVLVADGPGGEVVPLPSREPGNADETMLARFGHVVRDSVTRRARLRRAAAIAGVGVLLWGCNGYMRAQYVAASPPRDPFAQVSGLGVTASPAGAKSGGADGLDVVLVGLGVVFFLAMILASTRGQSALAQREESLQRARDGRLKELDTAVESAREAIIAFEKQRSIVGYAEAHARNDHGVATAGGTRS